jgi:rhamnosyltransferase
MPQTVGVAILTLNAQSHLSHCLSPLLKSPLNPRVLVVDSSSTDLTVGVAREMGAETLLIPREEFNHGLTREKARKHLNTDIVVFLTPDAYACDDQMLNQLVQPIVNDQAAAAYARQLPHQGAGFFEAFPRHFNYPSESHIRGIEDIHQYGVYTFFCSNSCAAYSNQKLDEIGGFRSVLLGEDTVAIAELLHK